MKLGTGLLNESTKILIHIAHPWGVSLVQMRTQAKKSRLRSDGQPLVYIIKSAVSVPACLRPEQNIDLASTDRRISFTDPSQIPLRGREKYFEQKRLTFSVSNWRITVFLYKAPLGFVS